ncbi:MAG: hypothetical protein IJ743_00755 [Bacilli bacterium]|nr:hypothetical protein [Bacilli bacterium]
MKRQKKKNPVIQHWYHIYLNDPSQRNIALEKLANLFKIPIDITRLDQYQMTTCDGSSCLKLIEYQDGKTVSYASYLKGIMEKQSLDCLVQEFHPNYTKCVIYDLTDDKCIKEQITIEDQGYQVTIERDNQESREFFKNFGKRVSMRLSKENEKLYEKTYTKVNNNEIMDEIQTEITYDVQPYSKFGNKVDKYSIKLEKGYIYGINCLEKKEIPMTVTGLCVENAHIPYHIYNPPHLDIGGHNNREYDIDSLMIFQGTNKNVSNFIEIEKKGQDLIIKFYGKTKEQGKTEPIILHLPGISENTITIEELHLIEESLSIYFQGNPLAKIAAEELKQFEFNLLNQKEEMLNPQDFLDCDFNTLGDILANHKEEYIHQLKNDFKIVSKDQRIEKQGLRRTLKKDY